MRIDCVVATGSIASRGADVVSIRVDLAFDQVSELRCALILSGQALAALWFSSLQALAAHGVRRNGVHAHRPASLKQIGVDAW